MALPQVMGALCDAVCQALRARDGVPVVKDVRMNDFLCNAVAAETSFGFSAGSVLLAYRSMLQDSTADAIENDLLADAIIAIADECSGQELTAREVLKRAKDEIVDDTAKLPAANQLHKWIDRWTPVLRQAGVEITRLQRRGNKRPYVIRRLPASDDTIDDTPHVFDQSSPSIEPDHDDSDDSDDMAIVSLTECYGDEKRDHGSMGMFIR
jgi:hypothetical protein